MANLTSSAKFGNNGVATSTGTGKISIATSGDTLTYVQNTGQELVLYNTSASAVVVTISSNGPASINVPKLGNYAVAINTGFTVSVPANQFVSVQLDQHQAFLQGTVVSITAATGAVVSAFILQ
jgi:hypothetical protein